VVQGITVDLLKRYLVGVQDDIHSSTSDDDHDRLAGIEI
jgi:hypothetical protein